MFTPKKNKELDNLEKAPQIDLKTMRLLQRLSEDDSRGLAPRSIFSIFERINKKNLDVTVSCSSILVHNENILDMLIINSDDSKNNSSIL